MPSVVSTPVINVPQTDIPQTPEETPEAQATLELASPSPERSKTSTPRLDEEAEEVSSDDSMMSDDDDDEATKHRRELERQRVLEAAGLSVKKERPAVPVRRGTHRNKRPPPATPSRNRNSTFSVTSQDENRLSVASLGVPSKPARPAPVPDAYDRYEAVLERSKTAPLSRNRSYSDARPPSLAGSNSPNIGSGHLKSPSQTSFTQFQTPAKESKLSGFMSRLSGAGGAATPERRSTPIISGPINAVPMDQPKDGEDDELAGIGLTWSSLVDPGLLQNLSARDRKRQEAIFEFIATESAYVRDLQLIVEVCRPS